VPLTQPSVGPPLFVVRILGFAHAANYLISVVAAFFSWLNRDMHMLEDKDEC
jgi:hypothetical protein